MVHVCIFLSLVGLGAASELLGFTAHKGSQANLLLPGAKSAALSVSASCSSFEEACDGYCVPTGSVCCSDGDGSYCDVGTYCQDNGCCNDGDTCSGKPTGCNTGKELCGDYCIPTDSVCCDDAGSYCDSGETCTSDGYCEFGSDGDDELVGGSRDCYSFQDDCDGYCIPADSVCCGDGYYCDKGETCASDGTCTLGSGSDDDDDDDDDDEDDEESQYIVGSASSTADSPYSLPTFSDSVDDDDDDNDDEDDGDDEDTVDTADDDEAQDEEEESSLCKRKGGKGGGGGGGDGGDDECGASGVTVPVILPGLVAILVFAL